MKAIRNLNIESQEELPTPREIRGTLSLPDAVLQSVDTARTTISEILFGDDPRYLVVIGPCSIHDSKAALEYAERLAELKGKVSDSLFLVMRTYFEKPRTSIGWKGFINDPYLDDSFQIAEGLHRARKLLCNIASLELAVGTEALDPITPQYLDDIISWYAIGARTVESQTHREMASGLSAPVGIKNGTDGSIEVMKNALLSVSESHHFLGISSEGRCSVFKTTGNSCAHGILRGGKSPNYDAQSIQEAEKLLEQSGLVPKLMIDCSHGNSRKQPERQPEVVDELLAQIKDGSKSIRGFMIESNLKSGNQPLTGPLSALEYGVSITDGCIGWDETEALLLKMDQELKA